MIIIIIKIIKMNNINKYINDKSEFRILFNIQYIRNDIVSQN